MSAASDGARSPAWHFSPLPRSRLLAPARVARAPPCWASVPWQGCPPLPHHMRRSWCAQGGDGACSRRAESSRGPFIRAGRELVHRGWRPLVFWGVVISDKYKLILPTRLLRSDKSDGGHRLVHAGGTVRLSALPPPPHVRRTRDPWHRPRGRGTSREPLRPAHTATATQAAVLGCTQTSAVREGVEGRLLGPSGPGSRGVPGTRLHAACGVSRHLVSSEQMSFCTMSTGQARPVDGRSIVAAIAASANEKSRLGEQNHACAAATWRGGEKEWSKSRQSVQGGAGRC